MKTKVTQGVSRKYITSVHNPNTRRMAKLTKCRRRKSSDQLRFLLHEFTENPNWSKEVMSELALKTGLSEAQVYKWGWDQKKKEQFQRVKVVSPPSLQELFGSVIEVEKLPRIERGPRDFRYSCNETLAPNSLDYDLYFIQSSYKADVKLLYQVLYDKNDL